MQNPNLRGYRPDDLEALYALDVLCFDPPFRFTRSAMRRFATASNAHVVIADSQDTLLGFCIVHIERVRGSRIGYIVTLDVAPQHRRQGLAQTLIAEAERYSAQANCDALALHVFAGNEAAIHFYARIGFTCIGLEEDFYGRGLAAEVWRKEIVPMAAAPNSAT
jgi:ribosomal-protein-alanine N-acetyltransferase